MVWQNADVAGTALHSMDAIVLASTDEIISQFVAMAGDRRLRRHLRFSEDALRQEQGLLQQKPGARPPAPKGRSLPRQQIPMRTKGRSTAPVRRQERCKCGQCRRCLENAFWERIFNENFADPTYYGGVLVRHNSRLAGEAR